MKKFICFLVAATATSAVFADELLLQRISKGVGFQAGVESTVNVFVSGKITGQRCYPVQLATNPPTVHKVCSDQLIATLQTSDLEHLSQQIANTQQGAMIDPSGGMHCQAVTDELKTYWVYDGNCARPRFLWSGYGPCGFHVYNNHPDAQALISYLDGLEAQLVGHP